MLKYSCYFHSIRKWKHLCVVAAISLSHLPSSSSLCPSPPPPWFLPSLVTHWTGAWWPRRIWHSPGIQCLPSFHAVLCALAKLHYSSVPRAHVHYVAGRNVGSLCQDSTFACEGPRGSWNGLNTRSRGFSPTADSSPDSSMWKGKILGLPCQSSS